MAMFRPLANIDSLLLAISVSVIVFSWWPAGPSMQHFSWRQDSGQVEEYSLAVDDPRLTDLTKALRRWNDHSPSRRLAVARWRSELAEFYSKQLASRPRQVVQASYSERVPGSGATADTTQRLSDLPSDARYWSTIQAESSQIVAAETEAMQRRRLTGGPPPVAMGEIRQGRRSGLGVAISGLAGMLTALAFVLWSNAFPAMRLSLAVETLSSAQGRSQERVLQSGPWGIRMEIPGEWVRIRQPVNVLVRRFVYLGLVVWAICCSLV